MEKNVNYGSNYGHIGDKLIIHQHTQLLSAFNKFMESGGTENPPISLGRKNILMMMLFNEHCDSLKEEFKKNEYEIQNNIYPLKIKVTQLVNDCFQSVYNNDGNAEEDAWEIVDSIFALVCILVCGSNFYAKRVYVGSDLYYELYPAIQ